MMIIDNEFEISQEVYLKTDPEQLQGFVIAIQLTQNGLTYCVTIGNQSSWHYGFELSSDKNVASLA